MSGQHNEEVRAQLAERLRSLLHRLEVGCTDGACDMHAPRGGMHTNGGCRCWSHMPDDLLQCALIADRIPKHGDKRCWNTRTEPKRTDIEVLNNRAAAELHSRNKP